MASDSPLGLEIIGVFISKCYNRLLNLVVRIGKYPTKADACTELTGMRDSG